ncbi:MAG: hypothetical protein KatS3mg111_0525 [Pirellulaceae bacterium]|nr:MAG: hypothetical protein KatS3mg111_0525 [Pirellulaceae bacterium]
MAGFQFRLDPLLQLRRRHRDQVAAAYSQATDVAGQLQGQVDEVEREIEDAQQWLRTTNTGPVDPQRALDSQRYQLHLERRRAELQQQLVNQRIEIAKLHKALVESEQRVKSLERLRERYLSQWTAEMQRRQQATLDQWAALRHWQQALSSHASSPQQEFERKGESCG